MAFVNTYTYNTITLYYCTAETFKGLNFCRSTKKSFLQILICKSAKTTKVKSLEIFQLYGIVYFILLLGGYEFSLNYPIASCSITIIVSTSGSLITNLLLGRPLLDSIANEKIILAYILIW